MSENYFDPILTGESNSPDTVNVRLGDLDAAIFALDASVQDELDAIIIGSGTSPAEVIAARTGLRYKAGSPPATLGATVGLLAANTIMVDAYGAVGDGSTNDTAAIQAALTAAAAGDTVVFSAGKTYKLVTGVTLAVASVTIMGYGATLNSSAVDIEALTISAAKCKVLGLTLIGPDNSALTDPTTLGNSRGIVISASHVTVRDCYVEGYRAGGIFTSSSYTTVMGCRLVRVRNRKASGADYGAIFGANGSHYMTVIGNTILNVHSCGIGLFGSDYCIISNNYIEGADWTVELASTTSMGMSLLGGINSCTISGNTIHRVKNEGIVISTGGTGETCDNNTISGNAIVDTAYHSIALRAIAGISGTPHYCRYNTVIGNTILATNIPGGETCDAAIGLEADSTFDFCTNNLVIGNNIAGQNSDMVNGIRLVATSSANVTYNSVSNNVVTSVTDTAINFGGQYSNINNNTIVNCGTGINTFFGIATRITGNFIDGSVTDSITLTGTPTRIVVAENSVDKNINYSAAAGTSFLVNNNALIDNTFFGVATLSGGTVNISTAMFATGQSECILQLLRKTQATAAVNTGALYVSNINQATNTVAVKSTNSSDDGSFYWRLVR